MKLRTKNEVDFVIKKASVFTLMIILIVLLGAMGCSGQGGPANDVQEDSAIESDASDDAANDEPESSDASGVALIDLDGNSIALSDFKGEIVVLNFWASWCPPCRQEMPDLNELDQLFKESGEAVFISVNLTDGQRETEAQARQYMEDNGFGFTVLIDDRGLLASQFNITAIPQTFVLDRDGNISGTILGATTANAILDKVNAVN